LKRNVSIAVCVLVLCSALLIVNVGTVMAYNDSYSFLEYTYVANPVTIDGKWTTADEWHDAQCMQVGPTANVGKFEYKLTSDLSTYYLMQFCLEFADNTKDAGDVWQICIDGPASASATAPQTTGFKIEITGHTTLTVYNGTGTGWGTGWAPTAPAVNMTWADSIATSPQDPSPHYICEIQFDKIALAGASSWAASAPGSTYGAGPYGVRVAMYDASKPSQGWIAWPPASSADNPSTWGEISDIALSTYPEGITVGLMVLTSSVVALLGFYYVRKRPKTINLNPTKL
jgi:hypothetical protein